MKKATHLCHVCHQRFEWNNEASWYGSRLDIDNKHPDEIFKICSLKCEDKAAERNPAVRPPKGSEE